MNKYVEKVIKETKEKYKNEPEFIQTVEEVLSSISPVIDKHPEYEKVDLLSRLVEPERMFTFRVTWLDDHNKVQVNTGYRCQFNGAIGPYKGGTRFQKNVNPSIIKFLGFEQTFKNSLTGLPLGGGKGGSDFDPSNKSDNEIMRFCQSYMTALYHYIDSSTDVPAGDMGVGEREIGYMFGQYRRLKANFDNGTFTGKSLSYGGSLIRPEATGYGAIYYLNKVLEHESDTLENKRIAVSGYGNVAWGILLKASELGAKVTYLSGPDGYIHDPDGINTKTKIDFIYKLRQKDAMHIKPYADKFKCEFVPNKKFWGVKDVDIYMPAAVQNEVDLYSAKKIVKAKVKYYIEVANMPTTNEALKYLRENGVIVAPSKAVNAGGVGVSGLEMSQNAEKLSWSKEKVDRYLKEMMENIYNNSLDAIKRYNLKYDLVASANIVGFEKVADAMMKQGIF